MGLNIDSDTLVSCEKNKARPVTHCDTFWTAVHETSTVVAQDQRVFPEGQPLSHDQVHAAMLSYFGNVEETLVPVPGSRAGSFMSS